MGTSLYFDFGLPLMRCSSAAFMHFFVQRSAKVLHSDKVLHSPLQFLHWSRLYVTDEPLDVPIVELTPDAVHQ